jgi:HNH endonuclease
VYKNGIKLSESHRRAISEGKKRLYASGFKAINPETGHGYAWRGVVLSCTTCGKELSRPPTQVQPTGRHFCDNECRRVWQRTVPIGINSPKWRRVLVKCTECGTEVLRMPSQLRHAKKSFCSTLCHDAWREKHQVGQNCPNWRGGKAREYGWSWPNAKRKVKKRDSQTCQECGITREDYGKALEVHHKIPFREFGLERHLEGNNPSNLITVCNRCHWRLEKAYRRSAA